MGTFAYIGGSTAIAAPARDHRFAPPETSHLLEPNFCRSFADREYEGRTDTADIRRPRTERLFVRYRNTTSMLEAVRTRARPYFEDAAPAHDWHHVQRVETLAETLVDRHPSEEIDGRVVTLAVALHDIGREKEDRGEIDDHSAWGAEEAGRILEAVGADAETIERVQHCVRAHRYSNAIEPDTLEAMIVSDADNLDALGAVGIARVFAHGGALGEPMYDPAVPVADDGTTAGQTQYNHLHKKILDLPERMYTDVGRAIADDRVAFVDTYLEQFDGELTGER